MSNFTVRISANDAHDFEAIDFSNASKGLLNFKMGNLFKTKDRYLIKYPIKIETFINRNESVGMVFFTREFINRYGEYDPEFIRYNLKSPIKGTIDTFTPTFKFNKNIPDLDLTKDYINVFTVRFVPIKYYELLNNKDTDGVNPSPVDIRVYLNDIFKPNSLAQVNSNQLELVDKCYGINPKFYELDWVDYFNNNLDSSGNKRPEPLVRTLNPKPYFK